MSTKASRGTKRTCQSTECGARFYDLTHVPITCPICGSIYELASSPLAAASVLADEKSARRSKKVEYQTKTPVADDDVPAVEADDALPEIEEPEALPADEDETFLEEEEEEGGDVSNIIGGPVAEGGEEP